MIYIDKDGITLVQITVDVDKLDKYSSVSDFEAIGPNYKRPQYYTTTFDLGLTTRDKLRFRQKLKEILTNNVDKDINLSEEILDRQIDELLFLRSYLLTFGVRHYKLRKKPSYEDKIKEVYNTISLIRQIDEEDKLTIRVVKKKVQTKAPSLNLPKAKNTKLLYQYISDSIKQYFMDNENEFALEYFLLPYKNQPLTLEVYDQRIKNINNSPKITGDSIVGYCAHEMLSYIKFLPQYPDSTRRNTLMSESQADFIISYLQLFGFHNNSFKLNIDSKMPFTTRDELRRSVKRFRTQFIKR